VLPILSESTAPLLGTVSQTDVALWFMPVVGHHYQSCAGCTGNPFFRRMKFHPRPIQGCQMVFFQTKNTNLGLFWSVLECKMLVYFTAIWKIERPFGVLYDLFGIFLSFWYGELRKNMATLMCVLEKVLLVQAR
jgi:hypothetical protein